MKILKLVLISFLVLIFLLLAGVLIFIKTFDVNKYLPQITQQIGKTINRKVHIGHANLTLALNGLSLELKGINISDDHQFGTNNFLSLGTADMGLDVAALLKRQVIITKITLDQLKISIIRSANGTVNVQTMVPAASQPVSGPTAANLASKSQANPVMALPALIVKSMVISHVRLSFVDQNPQAPLHLTVSNAEIKIDDFSLNGPFDFTINLNLAAKKDNNINMTGRCVLNAGKSAVQVTDIHIKSDLSQWDWEKVKAITPALDNLPLSSQIRGDVTLDIPQLNASSTGLQGLSVSLQMHAGSGEIDAQADIHGDMASPSYSFHLQSKGVKVQEVLDQSKAPYELVGEVNGEFTGTGQSFEPQAMIENLKGEGQLSLDNANVEKLNILKTVLDKLNFIPGLSGIVQNALDTYLPDNVKAQLDTDTTMLDKAQAHFKVENKTINLDSAQMASKLFFIDAGGTIDFDLNTNIGVKTYIASSLALPLTNAAKPLQGLLDDQNRLYVPGNVSGKLPFLSYRPQMDYLTKKTVIYEGAQQLQKVFNKNPDVGNVVNGLLNNLFK